MLLQWDKYQEYLQKLFTPVWDPDRGPLQNLLRIVHSSLPLIDNNWRDLLTCLFTRMQALRKLHICCLECASYQLLTRNGPVGVHRLSTSMLRPVKPADRARSSCLPPRGQSSSYSSSRGPELKDNVKSALKDEDTPQEVSAASTGSERGENSSLTRVREVEQKQQRWRGALSDDYDLEELLRNVERKKAQERSQELEEEDEKELIAKPARRERKETPVQPRTETMHIEELVALLREENAQDLCVIKVPEEVGYVDYFVVCSGATRRHLLRMADKLVTEVGN